MQVLPSPKLDARRVVSRVVFQGVFWGVLTLTLTSMIAEPPPRDHAACPQAQAIELAPASGRVLVATDAMPDPTFKGTRILLLDHSLDAGSLGVITNGPITTSEDGRFLLTSGGPVQPKHTLVLHTDDVDLGSRAVVGHLSLTSGASLVRAADRGIVPEWHRIYLGYSGWAPGQLEAEIAEGVWRVERY